MFKTTYIKIDDYGIDLIKNYSLYKHIDYGDIDLIEIRRGHFIKNRILTLSIGLVIFMVALFLGLSLIEDFNLGLAGTDTPRSYLTIISSSIFLFVAGILLILQSLKKGQNLIITIGNKNYAVPLIRD